MIRIQCLTIDCHDPKKLSQFWAQALDWKVTYESENEVVLELLDGSPAQGAIPDLLFLKNEDRKSVKNRLHFDLRPDEQMREVERLITLGASKIEIGQSANSDTTWVVLADPEGNEFCVLRALPTN